MADMAEITQVEDCWEQLVRAGINLRRGRGHDADYLHEFHGGDQSFLRRAWRRGLYFVQRVGCVSVGWRRGQRAGAPAPQGNIRRKFSFFPISTSAAIPDTTLGIPLSEMVVWDPYMMNGGLDPERLRKAKVILWKGHCSVHQRFLPEHVDNVRAKYPGIQVIVHPECRWEVCQKADGIGSTEGLLKMIRQAPSGTMFAVGTEIHLVNRMGKEFAAEGKKVITLDDSGCLCTTMFRISPQHLCWVLENLVEGNIVNQIKVKDDVKHWAQVALRQDAGNSIRSLVVGSSAGPRGDTDQRLTNNDRTPAAK